MLVLLKDLSVLRIEKLVYLRLLGVEEVDNHGVIGLNDDLVYFKDGDHIVQHLGLS